MRGLPWTIPPKARTMNHLAKDLKFVTFEKKNGIAYITMNRPERLNAMGSQMHDELGQCYLNFKFDPEVKVAIITGKGRAFCAGHDLKEQDERHRAGDFQDDMGHGGMNPYLWAKEGFQYRWGLPDCYYRIEKPIIAAVNGICLGSGWGIFYCCDIGIASTEARIGDAEIRGGHQGTASELTIHLPPKVAMHMALSGELMDAQRALELGLVSVVVPPEQLIPTAEEIARKIMALPWDIVKAYKQTLRWTPWVDPQHEARMRSLYSTLVERGTPNKPLSTWVEGPRAFSEKRSAKYQAGTKFEQFKKG